jgi:hypothetical protein
MVNGDSFAIIRKRPAVEDLWALENLPDWMTDEN